MSVTEVELAPSLKTIREWFLEKDENSELIIDEKWELKNLNGKAESFAVSHENLPFDIAIYFNEVVVKIIVYTNIMPEKWSTHDQRDIYRDLLMRNNKYLFTKYYLAGDKNKVALRTEINMSCFNKVEFNDGLQAIILGTKWLLKKTGAIEDKD